MSPDLITVLWSLGGGACIALAGYLLTQAFDWWKWRGGINGHLEVIEETLDRLDEKIDKLVEHLLKR